VRREAIVDAATARFVAAGYHRSPMAEIARDVGLSERGLLRYFPTKKHLLIAVAGRRFDFVNRWAAEVPPSPDGLRAFHALMELTRRQLAQPGLIELFVLVAAEAADRSGPAFEIFSEQYERGVSEMTAFLMGGVAMGRLRPDVDYWAIARQSIAVADGLQLQWVLSGGTLDLIGALQFYIDQTTPLLTLPPTATAAARRRPVSQRSG
jgi:AcrR family transcriptional regulator